VNAPVAVALIARASLRRPPSSRRVRARSASTQISLSTSTGVAPSFERVPPRILDLPVFLSPGFQPRSWRICDRFESGPKVNLEYTRTRISFSDSAKLLFAVVRPRGRS
jgi:hypothetical protein